MISSSFVNRVAISLGSLAIPYRHSLVWNSIPSRQASPWSSFRSMRSRTSSCLDKPIELIVVNSRKWPSRRVHWSLVSTMARPLLVFLLARQRALDRYKTAVPDPKEAFKKKFPLPLHRSGSKKRKRKCKRKRKSKSASNPNAKPEEGSLIEGSTDSHNESKVLKSDDEHSTEDEKTALVADVQQAVEDFSFMSPLEEEMLERNYARTRELAKDPDPWATWYGIQHLTWEAKLI